MAIGLIDRLTNFLLPVDGEAALTGKEEAPADGAMVQESSRRLRLKVHTQQADNLKIAVHLSTCFDDVQVYADYLKRNTAVIINYQQVDAATQQRMGDFLNGICYALSGTAQRISDQVVLYTYANITVDKKIFAYSVPTYVREEHD